MSGRRHALAFTLVEMLLALAVAGMVGVTTIVMLAGASSAAQTHTDTRQSSMRRQVTIIRLGGVTRSAAMVLAADDHALVLWTGDANNNAVPDLSELRRLQWDEDSQEVWVSQAPAVLLPGADTTYTLADAFGTITQGLAGTAAMPTQVLLQDITDWQVTLDKAVLHDARLLRIDLMLVTEQGQQPTAVIAGLRASGS